jgi:hypothetical protein
MYYDIAITEAINRIGALKSIMLKVVQQGQGRGASGAAILGLALADDMYPLLKQLQVVTDLSKGAVGRLTDVEMPIYEDNEATMDEVYARLDKTVAFLKTVKREDFDGADDKIVEMSFAEGKHFTARGYFTAYYIPNINFHAATAYAICRAHGFKIEKIDYAGTLPLIDNA